MERGLTLTCSQVDLGEPTHTLIPCWMHDPLPPTNQCTGCFAPALSSMPKNIKGLTQIVVRALLSWKCGVPIIVLFSSPSPIEGYKCNLLIKMPLSARSLAS